MEVQPQINPEPESKPAPPSEAKKLLSAFNETLKLPMFKQLGLKHPVLEYRTEFDRSKYSAIENIIRGFLKSFLITYCLKAGLNLVGVLLKFNKIIQNPAILIKVFLNKDNFAIGWFMGLLTGLMKGVITLSRIIRKKDDGYNGFLGGFIAGWISFFFWRKNNATFLACFMLSRAYDCYYNHLVNSGKIKQKFWHYPLLFSLMKVVTGYGWSMETYLISPDLERFYEKIVPKTHNDNVIFRLWQEMTRRQLVRDGIIKEPFLPPM